MGELKADSTKMQAVFGECIFVNGRPAADVVPHERIRFAQIGVGCWMRAPKSEGLPPLTARRPDIGKMIVWIEIHELQHSVESHPQALESMSR